MADPHHGGIEWTLVAENWSGRVEVVTAIDGRVSNAGVARYRQLEGRHLNPVSPRTFGPEVIALKTETRQSNLYISQAARTRVFRGDQPLWAERRLYQMEDYIQQLLAFDVQQGQATRVEKLVTFYTSRDPAVSDTLVKAATSAARHTDFAATFERHAAAWEELWRVCDVRVSGDERVQQLLRLHIAHVLQVCSRNTADLDAGLPARGLNGEAYRGHVFWDEIYALPFFNVRLPDVTRGLLMYRYRRIGEARAAAREAGLRGAMFPWQSGSEGIEETQRVHLNPVSGRWEPDLSRNQRHVNAAIFYNIWHYYQTTGDQAFLRDYGAEMMLEIARLWASIARFNPERERYEIHGVMGPDEFHEKYPDAAQGGLRNNAYTNVLVAWLCDIAGRLPALLPASRTAEVRERLGIGDDELAVWRDMSRRMFVPFQGDGIISQFEGYEDLEELDWDAYRAKYGNVQRLDRILRAEGKDPNRYKVTKQADTVMLFFLFRDEELREIFGRLGYVCHADTVARNVAYYDRRTSHGSTLSFVTHAGVLAAIDPDSSWERFLVALHSDADDIQDGTTKEGIHMGVMAGTLDLVQASYAGTFVRDGVLYFEPRLPGRLDGLSFPMQFRGTPIQVTLTGDRLTLAVHPEGVSRPVRVGASGDVRELRPGERTVFELSRDPATAGPAVRDPLGGHMPKFQAAIFDVDGVLVDSPHEKAWRESLRELMESSWRGIRGRTTWSPDAFTAHVYRQYVSGKPRMSGARAALDYFRVPDAGQRTAEYAQHKQELVVRLIQAGDFTAYPDALRFVIAAKDAGMLIAAASSSKNAALFLRQIRLDTFAQEHRIFSPTLRPGLTLRDYFDADVSGRDFAHGKPDPEIFLTAAHELGVEPGCAIVIEDASAGVQAAKAGGMAAIGVARADDADLLAAAYADLVVTTLDDVDTTALCEGRLARRQALCRAGTAVRSVAWPPARRGRRRVPASGGARYRTRGPPACSPKKRSSSADASGPCGSVYEPFRLPPDQAWPPPWMVQCSMSVFPSASW
jgi:trehalose/maltose hydrolase-like predicted phosphorylase/beta-phosphoglucomutase-like phosphatase (HAD superfamily)